MKSKLLALFSAILAGCSQSPTVTNNTPADHKDLPNGQGNIVLGSSRDEWDHVCPACKKAGKKSIITFLEYRRASSFAWEEIFLCSHGHEIICKVYPMTGEATYCIVVKPPTCLPYWDENGKYIPDDEEKIEWKSAYSYRVYTPRVSTAHK